MDERGVTMKTAQWRGCYHGDSTMEKRGITMGEVPWRRWWLPWTQYNVHERRITMDTAQWGGGSITMDTAELGRES